MERVMQNVGTLAANMKRRNVINSKMIYLDNNGTTFMPNSVINTMISYCNQGNPSAAYGSAVRCRKTISLLQKKISELCEIGPEFMPIITSGATEANNMIIRSIVNAHSCRSQEVPHIITTSIEHKSILACLEDLAACGRVRYTLLPINYSGMISLERVAGNIRSNTVLISVMAVNNELGTINNIYQIGKLAHSRGIPFHTDAVQQFGKLPIKPASYIDAFSISFHKFHGPPGVGMLVIRKSLIESMNMRPIISGSQNNGMRGGTENIISIGGAVKATMVNFDKRDQKNLYCRELNDLLIDQLKRNFLCATYVDYMSRKTNTVSNEEIIFLTPSTNSLPVVLLFAYVNRSNPDICNKFIKDQMEKNGIIISVGSACNTSSSKASHVVSALMVPDEIKKGIIRISWNESNERDDITRFVKVLRGITKN